MKRPLSLALLLTLCSLGLNACVSGARDPDAFDRGRAAYDSGDFPSAIEAFRDYTRIKPDDLLGWYNLGLAYQDHGQAVLATDAYERALKIDPSDARSRINLATVLLEQNEADAAEAAFQRAVKDETTRAFAHVAYANYVMNQGRDRETVHALLAIALEREPNDPEANRLMALLTTGDTALSHVARAVSETPRDLILLEDATKITMREDRFDLAYDYAMLALAIDPMRLNLWQWAAQSAYELEDYRRSLSAIWGAYRHGARSAGPIHYAELQRLENEALKALKRQIAEAD